MKAFKMISVRSVLSIQTIMVTRLLGGLYYNISPNRFVTLAARLYCVLITSTVVFCFSLYLMTLSRETLLYVVFHFIQYIVCNLVDFLTNGEYFLIFMSELEKIDFFLGSKPTDEIAFSRCFFIGVLINKMFEIVVYCSSDEYFSCLMLASTALAGIVIDLTVDLSHLTRIMKFEAMSCRTVMLRKRIERELSLARRFEYGEKNMEKNLKKCLIVYNNLVKTTHQCDAPMKFMVNKYLFCISI